MGDADRGLGGTVQVVHRGVAHRAEAVHGLGGQRFADAQHRGKARDLLTTDVGEERRQQRRHERRDRDTPTLDQVGEIRGVAVTLRRGDDQPHTGGDRPPVLPDRQVEGRLRPQQQSVVGRQPNCTVSQLSWLTIAACGTATPFGRPVDRTCR